MPGFKHATKKRFAKASTSKRSIQSGISAEYTEYHTKMERVVTAIKSLIKQIQATVVVWGDVARHQNAFAGALLAALPSEGVVRSHAREVEGTVRQLQRLIIEDEGSTAPHRRITSVLEAYLKLVENVQEDYHPVETSYTEVVRYQKKVDKLAKKGDKKQAVLQRNVDKLTSARAEHDRKLEAVLERMKTTYDKHEAIFQCAHHAFWIAQEKYSSIINDTTKSIRWESMAVREHLMKIDVNNSPRLPPIPRVQMLMAPADDSELPAAPIVELESPTALSRPQSAIVVVPPSPQPQSQEKSEGAVTSVQYVSTATGERVTGGSGANSSSTKHPVVHLTPEAPSVSVALPPKDEQVVSTVPRRSRQGNVIYIPAVPTEQPQMPVPRPRSTNAAEPAIVSA